METNNMYDEKVITVAGNGKVRLEPDVTRLDINLTTLHDTYEAAYNLAKEDTDKLNGIMKELGLPTTLPKTMSMDIDKKFENEYDQYHNKTGERFKGFVLEHNIRVDINMDTVLLNKLVQKIGKVLKQAEISIGYTVKDTRKEEMKMLHRAVTDAKEKAEIMAAAAGCELGLCKKIDYGYHSIHVYSQSRCIHDSSEAVCCNAESFDITPEDFQISDQVNVTWYLSNKKG